MGVMHALHACDVKACINPDHINPGTHAKNLRDAASRGLIKSGERHYKSKTTEEINRQIRKEKGLHKDIAQKYGLLRRHVSKIKAGK